ncbi:MAG: MTH938/NDUFAF3 family protein [Gammaproteobacteria bacterium]|nr:MTH938/NDUFAF3 family protein [Gammaproteobacteria bacterium]
MIRSVSDQAICIGDKSYQHTIALTSDTVMEDWPDTRVSDLAESDFSMLLSTTPEIIVLGTGMTNVFPPRELVFALARRGVGLEAMDTRAAARTFNVLAGENRPVVAVLYL